MPIVFTNGVFRHDIADRSATPPADPNAKARSTITLASDVLRQGSNLIRQEVQLAKAEASEKLAQLKAAIAEIIGGTISVMVSLGILLSALVSAVARLLVGLFGDNSPAGREVIAVGDLGEREVAIVTAVNRNVDAALDAARTLPTYEGLAALIVGLIFAVFGVLLLKKGLNALDAENLAPERTVRQVKKDGEMVREQT